MQAEHEAATSPIKCAGLPSGRLPAPDRDRHRHRPAQGHAGGIRVTRDPMDGQGIQTFSDALRCTSGVRSEEEQTSANNLFMRGLLAEGKSYLDGLRIHPAGYFSCFAETPYALERVEVLRGPASTLYCQASGGCVVS
ncbi:TonB-dependent receptor plug domain-containing protein [Comamonas testosteroni]|uniref:TonB-dependent receptor plug domain-containing protein n=1 Tax=Comamonas testosteroni TaxID=285 RepID=UPI0034E262F6